MILDTFNPDSYLDFEPRRRKLERYHISNRDISRISTTIICWIERRLTNTVRKDTYEGYTNHWKSMLLSASLGLLSISAFERQLQKRWQPWLGICDGETSKS
jgi:hypothetical protein